MAIGVFARAARQWCVSAGERARVRARNAGKIAARPAPAAHEGDPRVRDEIGADQCSGLGEIEAHESSVEKARDEHARTVPRRAAG